MTVVPAIDILGGKCVRLTKGDYSTGKVYSEDPLEVALGFQECGIRRLHLVDLDGAGGDHIANRSVLGRICRETSLSVDFGGGIKSDGDIDAAFGYGASMVTVGSAAALDPDSAARWIGRYGTDRIILGADARNGRVATNGWKNDGGWDLYDFIAHYHELGIRRVICTDINLDGTLQGPATELYRSLLARFPDLLLTASGGVSSVEDLKVLAEAGLDAAIVGKAYYEGRITIQEMVSMQ
ncbi:MAG: 1-(5-phosphoribosyl)-5-[(5-phosphoribosylamino)methylideneamino]imidazole-4-carboxamide isomerase [Bacteroidaceae bacterium]|nr:1-(5-phosphoribosyl)-5-[(5-phosphoribosylamino)methylideneamino]imidazole-4-carboxamide isomerase [Bacteroidaceae bacterium]